MPNQLKRITAFAAIVGGVLFLFLFGFYGLGREGSYGFDFHVFHEAGMMFLNGQDFWRAMADSASPYSYPPHATSIIAVYAALPFNVALFVHSLLNLASLASIVYLAHRWFLKFTSVQNIDLAQGLGLAIIIGNPFVAHVFFMGQLSIIAVAAVLLSWHMLNANRHLLSGVLLAIATIKPQISLLYVIWLLLNLNFRVLFYGAGMAFLMMLPALVLFGPIGAFASWFASMAGYTGNITNNLGATHVFGIENAMSSVGLVGPLVKVFSLGMLSVCLVAMHHYRRALDPCTTISFLFALSVFFVYAHDYDLASLGIMYSFLVTLSLKKLGVLPFIVTMGLLVLLFFPQRFVRDIDLPLLSHWRVFILPLCCYLLIRLEKRDTARKITAQIQPQSSSPLNPPLAM